MYPTSSLDDDIVIIAAPDTSDCSMRFLDFYSKTILLFSFLMFITLWVPTSARQQVGYFSLCSFFPLIRLLCYAWIIIYHHMGRCHYHMAMAMATGNLINYPLPITYFPTKCNHFVLASVALALGYIL